jgi:outer membrane protein assembly factor BamB
MAALKSLLTAVSCLFTLQAALAEDWPQWRGPRQDGISHETGLLDKWPEKGPAELWRVPLGGGFSAVSVVGDRGFTLFSTADTEFATAFNAADGKPLWKTRLSDRYSGGSYGDGPRAAPTLDAGKVYVLSAKGALQCLDAADGQKLWGCDLLEKFGGKLPEYGFAAAPVVMGDMLVVEAGAGKGKTLAAFNKITGSVLWTTLDDRIGYSTPVEVAIGGVSQIVILTGQAVVGLSPKDGKEFWRHEWITTLDANVATPVVSGNRLFMSSGYGTGCALFELAVKDGKPAAEKLWANLEMKNVFSTSVLVDGYLYGFSDTRLACVDFRTGKPKWKTSGFNKGSLLAADGKLIVLGEHGDLALAEISPSSYKPLAKFKLWDEQSWTVPTLSGGRLFVRNEKELVCLKVAK